MAAGCGGGSTQASSATRPDSAAAPLPPLQALPPAGARWVLVARPEALWQSPAARRIVHAVLPRERIDALAARTGVDIRQLQTVVIAGYSTGTLVIARGPFDAGFVVRELAARMTPQELALDHPFPRRTGYLGETRRTFAALSEHTLATIGHQPRHQPSRPATRSPRRSAGRDEPRPASAHATFEQLLRRAAHAPKAPPAALSGAQVEPLLERYRDHPLVLYAPRPLELPRRSGIGLLLAQQRSLAIVARPTQDVVGFETELRGEFPPGSVDNFQRLFESLAASDLGSAFGLESALKNLSVHAGPGRISLRFRIPAAHLARGAGMLLGRQPWSWLDESTDRQE